VVNEDDYVRYEGGSNDNHNKLDFNMVGGILHSCTESECSLPEEIHEAEDMIAAVRDYDEDTRIQGKDALQL